MSTPEELQRQFNDADSLNNENQRLTLKVNAVFQYLLEMVTGGDHSHDKVAQHEHPALEQELKALIVRVDALNSEVESLRAFLVLPPVTVPVTPPEEEPVSGGVGEPPA